MSTSGNRAFVRPILEVTALYAVSGDYDLIGIIATETTEKLSKVLDSLADLVGIERTTSLVVLETKFVR